MTEQSLKHLEQAAATGNAKAIRELSQARHPDGPPNGRDPSLYPWAGDRWRRMHWSILVLDPCLLVEKNGRTTRHVKISEGFAAKNEHGRVEHSRDSTGRRVPATQKTMPWPEWLWLTSNGGWPQKMRGYRVNKTPAQCTFMVPPAALPTPPAPPAPPLPPPPPNAHCDSPMTCRVCLEAALKNLEAPIAPPPPPPGAPRVPPP